MHLYRRRFVERQQTLKTYQVHHDASTRSCCRLTSSATKSGTTVGCRSACVVYDGSTYSAIAEHIRKLLNTLDEKPALRSSQLEEAHRDAVYQLIISILLQNGMMAPQESDVQVVRQAITYLGSYCFDNRVWRLVTVSWRGERRASHIMSISQTCTTSYSNIHDTT